MKKAKIMLSALAVVAVVGGALAFKATKFNGTFYCSTTKTVTCPTSSIYTTSPVGRTLFCSFTTAASPNCSTLAITEKVLPNN
jgi:hypothetical protein